MTIKQMLRREFWGRYVHWAMAVFCSPSAAFLLVLLLYYPLITSPVWAQTAEQPVAALLGWLGARLENLTQAEAEALGWEAPRGAKIIDLIDGTPAAAAGLRPGDVIVTLDGVEVENRDRLTAAVGGKGASAQVKLRLLRAGKEKTVMLRLGARPASTAALAPDAPQLMLDTGGHMSKVTAVAVTSDGKQIVSASQDKTIRVWDIETGMTVRIIRGEAASGNWGTIFAMALSPDGRWLAVGGQFHNTDRTTGSVIRLYDFASGKLESLLKGHSDVVIALAFSPDGKHLISGSEDKTAILWDLEARKQILQLTGHAAAVSAVALLKDGTRIVTGSKDETLRLWNAADGKLVAEMTQHREAAQHEVQVSDKSGAWHAGVEAVAISPSDRIIASGSTDGRILLWDAQSGTFIRQLAFPGGMRGFSSIRSLSFNPDGRWLLSTSDYEGCQIYEVASGHELYDGKLSDKPLTAFDGVRHTRCNGGAAYSPDGRLAAASYNSVVHIIDPQTSKVIKTLQGSGAAVFGVGFAEDGKAIAWGNSLEQGTDNKSKLTRRLRLPLGGAPLGDIEAISAGPQPETYIRSNARHGPWSVAFKNADQMLINPRFLEISKDGKVETQIDLGDRSRVAGSKGPLTFTPDGQNILLGLAPEIEAYDASGRVLGAFIGHDGMVRDLAPSPDGRFLLSGSGDQTVRLWNLKTRELIVTFVATQDGEWVMWTPQGFYASSPGADGMVGWQINHGSEREADYITAAQLRRHLNRPDIVTRAIELSSAEAAVKEAPGANFKLDDLLAKPMPKLRIIEPVPIRSHHSPLTGDFPKSVPTLRVIAPAPDLGMQDGDAKLQIELEPVADPVKVIRIQVNGRQIAEYLPVQGAGFAPGAHTFSIPLSRGENKVTIAAINETGETKESVTLIHESQGRLDKRGVLYILAIGVDKYPNMPGNDLRYAGADAVAFAEATEKRMGPLYEKVVKRVLINGGAEADMPTATHVLDALGMLRFAQENDTILVFVSGHGANEGQNYRFLPTDAAFDEKGFRPASIVPWFAFQEALEAAKGRRIMFIDTCHSGNAYNQRLGNESYHANIIVYSSARWDQLALENEQLGGGHGLFTYAVVEGVNGAASGPDGAVTSEGLRDFVRERVKELAAQLKGEQKPQYYRGRDVGNDLLLRVK